MNAEKPLLMKLVAQPADNPEVDFPRPERRVTGNPERRTWNLVDEAIDAGRRVFTGIWQCEPGRWKITMAPGNHELFTVLSGRCRVHAADGSHVEAGPGEAVYMAPGFDGEFEVLESLSKSYMIIE